MITHFGIGKVLIEKYVRYLPATQCMRKCYLRFFRIYLHNRVWNTFSADSDSKKQPPLPPWVAITLDLLSKVPRVQFQTKVVFFQLLYLKCGVLLNIKYFLGSSRSSYMRVMRQKKSWLFLFWSSGSLAPPHHCLQKIPYFSFKLQKSLRRNPPFFFQQNLRSLATVWILNSEKLATLCLKNQNNFFNFYLVDFDFVKVKISNLN